LTVLAEWNKSQREHTLPLTDITCAILESRLKLVGNSPFVFPGRQCGHMNEYRAVLLRLRKQMGWDWIWHDCRRTALSTCEKAGVPYLAIQKIANHTVKRSMTDRYIILDLDYLRPHMESMNDRLLSLMGITVKDWIEAN